MNVMKLFDISEKVIVVTGATGNLGMQYVEGLSQVGANVIIADLKLEKCINLANEIKNKYNVDPLPIKLDLNVKKSIISMVRKIYSKYSKIDVLVNNAAYQGDINLRKTNFENFPLESWNKALAINLTGIFLACQEVGKIMSEQGDGNIINIASTYGIVAPDQRIYGDSGENAAAFYSASKGAVINLTRYLASYWQGSGIRVNTLSPGGVQRDQDPTFIEKYSERTMLGRMANKDEYIGSLLFLASDASSYMTGSNLVIDGGWTAW